MYILITLFKNLLLPPAIQLLMMLLGFLLWSRRRWLALLFIMTGWAGLLVLAMPIVSSSLFNWLESPYLSPLPTEIQIEADAIVVLGAGRSYNNPEYGGDQISHHGLWRLRYGARLSHQLNLPVIVSGGTVYPHETISEATLSLEVLRDDFSVESNNIWLEMGSRNTWQNARKTAELLQEKGISKAILVTHAYHMRRAEAVFRFAGVEVLPMATGFISTQPKGWWNDYVPNAGALHRSRIALHEYLGLIFYRIRQL